MSTTLRNAASPRGTLPSLAIMFALVATLTLAIARPAAAQGVDGLPSPITAADLNRYAVQLELSIEQRIALDPAHEQYMTAYWTLVQETVDRLRDLQSRLVDPDEQTVRQWFDARDRSTARLATLDGMLFDGVSTFLREDQAIALERLRQRRERLRIVSVLSDLEGAAYHDLWQMVQDLETPLEDDELARADEVLAPYERRFTREVVRLAKLERAYSIAEIGLNAASEQAGMAEAMAETAADLAAAEQASADVLAQRNTVYAPVVRQAVEMRKLHRDTHRQLLRVLPRAAAVELREVFVYFDIAESEGVVSQGPSGVWLDALGVPDLGDDVRSAIEAGLDAAFAAENQLLEPIVKAEIRAEADSAALWWDWDDAVWEASARLHAAFYETLATRRDRAANQVAGLLGADWVRRTTSDRSERWAYGGPGGEEYAFEDVDDEAFLDPSTAWVGPDLGEAWEIVQWVPMAMNASRVRHLTAVIDLPEPLAAVLQGLHQEYLQTWSTHPALAELIAAWEARHAPWTGAPTEAEFRDRFDRLSDARGAAVAAVDAIEEAWFDDVALALGDTAEQRSIIEGERRLRRLERRIQIGETFRSGDSRRFVSVIHATPFAAADRLAAYEALGQHLEELMRTAANRYETRLDVDATRAARALRAELARANGDADRFFDEAAAEAFRRLRRDVSEGEQAFTAACDAARDAMAAAVSEGGRTALADTVRRQANPAAYRDPTSMIGRLERALRLEDLDAARRDDLSASLAAYQPEWTRFSNELADVSSELERLDSSEDPDAWEQSARALRRGIECQIRRSNLNVRMANRLRSWLREDQLAAIGGLPPMEHWADFAPYFW